MGGLSILQCIGPKTILSVAIVLITGTVGHSDCVRTIALAAMTQIMPHRRSVAEWIDFSLADGGCFDVAWFESF